MGWVGTRPLFLWLLVFLSGIPGNIFAQNDCAVLTAGQQFEVAWTKDFSRFPDLDQTSRYLGKKLLAGGGLRDDVRAYLEKGGDPLRMGDQSLLKAFETAFRKIIDAAQISDEHKAKLHSTLTLALADLASDPVFPHFAEGGNGPGGPSDGGGDGSGGGGGGNGGGGSGGAGSAEPGEVKTDPVAEDLEKYLKRSSVKRCISRTTILFAVSNVFNTAGALQAKWEQYAGPDAGIEALLDGETWNHAWADDEFRHNVVWNVMLMTSLGAFSCMSSQKLGKNILGVIAAVSSMAGQYLSTGKISLVTTIHDTLFVRFISVNKTMFVFRMAEAYGRRRLPARVFAEAAMQGVSETIGAMLYPRTLTATKAIWKD